MNRLVDEIIEAVAVAIEESNSGKQTQTFDIEDFNEFSEIRY